MWHRRLFCLAATTLLSVLRIGLVDAGTNAEGVKFLEQNAEKNGVIVLESGLQYKVLRVGSGTDNPTVDSSCECHYMGKTINGHQFDSSYDRGKPTSFAPNQVIKGWTEAMQLMVEGDKWEMYIPSELAYGDRGRPPHIGGGDVLIFTMEIIKIKGKKVPAMEKAETKNAEKKNLRMPLNNSGDTDKKPQTIFSILAVVGILVIMNAIRHLSCFKYGINRFRRSVESQGMLSRRSGTSRRPDAAGSVANQAMATRQGTRQRRDASP